MSSYCGGDRYRATVRLLNTRDLESACYGDSGGPLFVPDQQTIVGVTSFGNPVCRGVNYYQRMDLPRVLT